MVSKGEAHILRNHTAVAAVVALATPVGAVRAKTNKSNWYGNRKLIFLKIDSRSKIRAVSSFFLMSKEAEATWERWIKEAKKEKSHSTGVASAEDQ